MLQEIIKTIQSQSIKPNKIQVAEVTLEYLKNDSRLLYNGYPKSNDGCFKNGKKIPTVTYICGIPIEVTETAIVPIYVY